MSVKSARVHRFQNKVAIDTESGETVYLSPMLAIKFAHAILNCASDISQQPKFHLSQFPTMELKE